MQLSPSLQLVQYLVFRQAKKQTQVSRKVHTSGACDSNFAGLDLDLDSLRDVKSPRGDELLHLGRVGGRIGNSDAGRPNLAIPGGAGRTLQLSAVLGARASHDTCQEARVMLFRPGTSGGLVLEITIWTGSSKGIQLMHRCPPLCFAIQAFSWRRLADEIASE